MKQNCINKNPLVRNGASQKDRLFDAFRKEYVQIDEHSLSDLLVFAKKMAERLKYYDIDNQVSGDWTDFLESDVSILIAILTQNRPEEYELGFNQIIETLTGNNGEIEELYNPPQTAGGLLDASVLTNLPGYVPSFKKLFDYILSLAYHLDRQVSQLPENTGLKAFAYAVIQQHCNGPFRKMLGIYLTGIHGPDINFSDYTLIDHARKDSFPRIKGIQQVYIQDIIQKGLSSSWLGSSQSWQDLFTSLNYQEYQYAYGSPPATMARPEEVEQRLLPALKTIEAVFSSLLKAYTQIIHEAPRFLNETLESWPTHQPHQALYLVFLKLYRFAQSHLNDLKERHTDYYYKEVLRLKEKDAQPNQVHLVLQLAKHIAQNLLEKETAFLAGKDDIGQELVYKATEDTALNKARIALIKAAYRTQIDGKIYTADIANSADGEGAELHTTDGQWKAFGPVTQFVGDPTQTHPEIPLSPPLEDEEASNLFKQVSQFAEVGFAIASPNLLLREGERSITFTLEVSLINPELTLDISSWNPRHFKILLSGEEGWIEKIPNALPTFDGTNLVITCAMSAEEPAVLAYNAEVHAGSFQTEAPIAQILLQEADGTSIYNELRKLELRKITTKVDVSGVRDLIVHNEAGRLDLSKPFQPFGSNPKIGAAFILGSKEIFQKKLVDTLSMNLEWDGLDDIGGSFSAANFSAFTAQAQTLFVSGTAQALTAFGQSIATGNPLQLFQPGQNIKVRLEYLKNHTWKGGISDKDLIDRNFSSQQNSISISDNTSLRNLSHEDLGNFDYSPNEPYSVKSLDSFLRVSLRNSFGHQTYFREYPRALIELSKAAPVATKVHPYFQDGTNIVLKDPPYTPVFKSLSVSYIAESAFGLEGEIGTPQFQQRAEQFFHVHPLGQREEHSALRLSNQSVELMPQYDHEGMLYIGIADVKPQQSVSVLFQVAEGSANPLAKKQDLEWHFLYQNNWLSFNEVEDSNYVDDTNGLLQSGIIQFFLPLNINLDNTWLPSEHIWIRAGVKQSSDAISNLISIQAQALAVRFSDQGNDENFLAKPLEAGKIKKLQTSDAAIKKIQQPYSAVGGHVKEKQTDFYKRISERLRHKDRAITIWDYEHLVLEHFPEIYKVKCLNHTQLKQDPNNENRKLINGASPGNVLFVAVPELKNRNAIDPLKPYTSLKTLDEIKLFLEARLSPHVKIDVVNPLFEAIKLDFQVRFHPGKDFTLFKQILEQDIIGFLSPWAFESEAPKDISFGGRTCKSVLLNFVEKRPYVDFVTQFRMDQLTGPGQVDLVDVEEAIAGTARSILVSHSHHEINKISDNCL